jgi:recombination protein RecR
MEKEIQKLIEYFKTFPGIGKRQAERFAYHVLSRDENWTNAFREEIRKARAGVLECSDCFRIFKNSSSHTRCSVCSSGSRNRSILAVLERNIDAESFLSKSSYDGLIFILGGNISLIEKKSKYTIRLEELINYVKKLSENNLSEIILCTSLTADGLYTASHISNVLKDRYSGIKITTLGRGFSTGTEIEYVDRETLDFALKNRGEHLL